MPEESFVVSVCREMGWTYEEYCTQPDWFIDTIEVMMKVEGEKSAEQNQKKVVN